MKTARQCVSKISIHKYNLWFQLIPIKRKKMIVPVNTLKPENFLVSLYSGRGLKHGYIYIYISVCVCVCVYVCVQYSPLTEGFFEVAKKIWTEWDLNPRPLNFVQTLKPTELSGREFNLHSEPTLYNYYNLIICSVSSFILSIAFVSHHAYFY